jgi:hypothetical protein
MSTRADNRIARRIAKDRRDTQGRRLQLVDIENLAGGAGLAPDVYRRVWHIYRHYALTTRPGDQVVLAGSRRTVRAAAPALLGEPVQWRVRDGKDGADLALLEYADLRHAVRRFSTLVIASGDHIFADLARAAGDAGMRTHQIIGRGFASIDLWRACDTHAKLLLGAG